MDMLWEISAMLASSIERNWACANQSEASAVRFHHLDAHFKPRLHKGKAQIIQLC